MKHSTDYKITCRLASPIAFGPPMLDAVLANMARRLGRGGRPTPISRNARRASGHVRRGSRARLLLLFAYLALRIFLDGPPEHAV